MSQVILKMHTLGTLKPVWLCQIIRKEISFEVSQRAHISPLYVTLLFDLMVAATHAKRDWHMMTYIPQTRMATWYTSWLDKQHSVNSIWQVVEFFLRLCSVKQFLLSVVAVHLWFAFISCCRSTWLLCVPDYKGGERDKHMQAHSTHTHGDTDKHLCWVPQWKADAIIKGMIHLLIFKGLPSFQCISHFSPPLHLNLSIHLSLLMSLPPFSVSQSVPSFFSVSFVFFPLSTLSVIAFCISARFTFQYVADGCN